MIARKNKGIGVGVGVLVFFIFLGLTVGHLMAADPIAGQWNYTTSNHWAKGPVPSGKPSTGSVVITQSGDQFKMEFKSGMVFSPPELKYFRGTKKGLNYFFSNSAPADNEGGVAKNTCDLKMTSANQFQGKSFSEYSNSGITFNWGFDSALTR